MPSNYYGKQGPRFTLINDKGTSVSYDLPSPQEMSEFPWKLIQEQERDINNILRTEELEFIYDTTYSWKPTDTSGSTVITQLVSIINWNTGPKRRIKFYPHRDELLVNFDVVVTAGSPGIFSKMPYDAFTITVTSKNTFKNIPSPDALTAVEIGNEIEIE